MQILDVLSKRVSSVFNVSSYLISWLWTNNYIKPLKCGVTHPAVTTNIHSLWHRLWTCPQNGKLCMKAVETLISINLSEVRGGESAGQILLYQRPRPQIESLNPPIHLNKYIHFFFFFFFCRKTESWNFSSFPIDQSFLSVFAQKTCKNSLKLTVNYYNIRMIINHWYILQVEFVNLGVQFIIEYFSKNAGVSCLLRDSLIFNALDIFNMRWFFSQGNDLMNGLMFYLFDIGINLT